MSGWQDELDAAMREALACHGAGDVAGAFARLDAFLATAPSDTARAEALAFRADLHLQDDDVANAKARYREALRLHPPRTDRRHVIEAILGHCCERLGERDEAVAWYHHALVTCEEAPPEEPILAAGVVRSYVNLRGGQERLSLAERGLCETALDRHFRTSGQLATRPDFADLVAAAGALIDASAAARGPG